MFKLNKQECVIEQFKNKNFILLIYKRKFEIRKHKLNSKSFIVTRYETE